MIKVQIRKQGGAAIVTIPANVLKMLNIDIGTILELDVNKDFFTAKPIKQSTRKRYTLNELLHGITHKDATTLKKKTRWAREGKSTGREIT